MIISLLNGILFIFADILKNHRKKNHSTFKCLKCPEQPEYHRKSSLSRHISVMHDGVFPTTICQLCRKNLETEEKATSHFNKHHKQDREWEMHDHALKKHVQNWRTMLRMANGVEGLLSEAYLEKIVRFLKVHRNEHPHFKLSLCVVVVWAASATENFTALKQIPVRTYSRSVLLGTNLRELAISMIQELIDRLEKFEHNGSGYILQEIMSLDLEIFNFVDLRAGCANINLRKIPNSKHLLSVENTDQHCLLYSVAVHFHHHCLSKVRQSDPKNYQQWISDKLCVDDMEFPSGIKDIKKTCLE